MKGIIAELHNDYIIVISDKGDFIKQRKVADCNIGDEVNILSINRSSFTKQIAALAASFIIIAMLVTGAYAYYTPYSYVSIDINPSLGLSINRFEKVIGVKALNEDAEKLLNASAGISNRNIDAAVAEIIEAAYVSGYLKSGEENSVMFVISADNKKEQLKIEENINKTSSAELAKISQDYNIISERAQVGEYKKAINDNISPGKAILMSRLKDVKPEMEIEEAKQMSVQQAMNIIKESKKENKKEDNKKSGDENENKEKQTAEVRIDADKESEDKKEQKQKEDKKATDKNNSDNKNKDKKSNNHDNGDNINNNQDNENNKSNNDSKDKDDIGIAQDKDNDKNKDKNTSNNNESNTKDNKKDTDKEDIKANKENGQNKNKDENNKDKKDINGNGKKK